ncbi:galactosylceramide sulfotransferase-like isoform X2 [Amblyomma americanum]
MWATACILAMPSRHPVFAVLLLVPLCLLFSATMIFKPVFNFTGRARPIPSTSSPEPQCTPRSSLCFLKTHKCASSAMQNILMRYGERHGLAFALPPFGLYLGNPAFFNRTQVMGSPPFDMLVHHTRFYEEEVRAVLKPDAVFVTIVREPAALFESLFSYYDLEANIKVKLEQLPSAVNNASLNKPIQDLLPGQRGHRHGINQMSFDLGFDIEQADNATAAQAFIEHVDTVFDLVMVAERINESLILLRHLLCWDMDDVVVFRLNARQNGFRRPMSSKLADELRALNAVDTLLYEHFLRRFEQRVQAFGWERMEKELTLLEQRTQFWYQRCVAQEVAADTRDKDNYTAKVLTLQRRNGSGEVCFWMTAPERLFTKQLRINQLYKDAGLREAIAKTRLKLMRRMGRRRKKRLRDDVNGTRLHRVMALSGNVEPWKCLKMSK